MNINHPGKLAVFAIILFVGAYAAGYYAPHHAGQPPIPITAPVDDQLPVEEKVTVTALSVLEDSRCPANANCIHAGTVRITAEATLGQQREVMELTLDQPKQVFGKTITLTQVAPQKVLDQNYQFSDYSFTFEIR